MFDQSAIQQLTQSEATKAVNEAINNALDHVTGSGVVALPEDFNQLDLEKYLPLRRRARNSMSTEYVADFVKYVTEHKEEGCTIYVSAEAMSATAVLNQGTPEKPGHCDNRAKVSLKRLALFTDILQLCAGGAMSQRGFAEWLEERKSHVKALDKEQADLTLTHVVSGIRSVTIERASSANNTVQTHSAERSELESVMAKAKSDADKLPTYLTFTTKPYLEIKERTFFVAVNLLTSGREPQFSFTLWGKELHQEEMAKEFADLVSASFEGEGAPPVLLGALSTNS